jgi:tRNA 2-thiouridine synthesizing protein A
MTSRADPVVVDGGDRACVALLLEIRGQLEALPAGTLVHLLASDPAAPIDLAAWCHLTGHVYLGPLPDADGIPGYALRINGHARPTDPASPWRPAGGAA